MVDIDKVTQDILKAISDLKKSGIIESIIQDAAVERHKKVDEATNSEDCERPDSSATSHS